MFFFPVGNSHFGRPKTNFSQKKKKKKKKRSSPIFITFPPSIFNFPPSLFRFFLFFCSLFSLPLFSWYVSTNFPIRSLWGHSAPCLLRHWLGQVVNCAIGWFFFFFSQTSRQILIINLILNCKNFPLKHILRSLVYKASQIPLFSKPSKTTSFLVCFYQIFICILPKIGFFN